MAGSNMSPVAPGARAQPPPPLSLGAGGDGATLKVAVTVAFLVREQRPVPAQSPLHPAKTDPGSGAAVRFTVLPRGNLPLHVARQSIPAGLDVTVPMPAPTMPTVTVRFATTLANAAQALIRPPVDTFPLKDAFLSTVFRIAFLSWVTVRLGFTESNNPASPAT
jgi:hypothetical protein